MRSWWSCWSILLPFSFFQVNISLFFLFPRGDQSRKRAGEELTYSKYESSTLILYQLWLKFFPTSKKRGYFCLRVSLLSIPFELCCLYSITNLVSFYARIMGFVGTLEVVVVALFLGVSEGCDCLARQSRKVLPKVKHLKETWNNKDVVLWCILRAVRCNRGMFCGRLPDVDLQRSVLGAVKMGISEQTGSRTMQTCTECGF